MKLRLVLLVVLFSFPLFAATEQPVIPRAAETIDVSLVNLDVIVTDRSGHRIHGLTPADFEVREDGKPQAITNFSAYTTESPVRERRSIALFIDRYFDARFRVEPTYEAIKKMIHEVVAPGDSVLIATWNGYANIALDSTDNLNAVDQTLDAVAKSNTSEPFAYFSPFSRNYGPLSGPALVRSDGIVGWALAGESWYNEAVRRHQSRAEVAAINSVINAMAGNDGRKALILITTSVGPAEGQDYFYTVDRRVSKWHDYYRSSAFDTVKATATAQNVAVYAFPPFAGGGGYVGLLDRQGPDPAVEAEVDRVAALRDVAKATGGIYAVGTDILKAVPRLRDDLVDYYSFAYRAATRNDNRMRNVVVKTTNPQYSVRSRRQYFEKTDDARMRDGVVALFLHPTAPSGINVAANVGEPVQKARHRFSIPVSVEMPANALMTAQDEGRKGAFSVYIATGGGAGEMSDITKRTLTFSDADIESARATGKAVQYHFDLVTDNAAKRLSIGVFDEVSHDSGFAAVDLPRRSR